MNRNGNCSPVCLISPALQRAQGLLQQAKQYLCAGCKRQCERRLTEFGGQPDGCRQR